MLAIRLFRIGRKHQPSYKIVVTDKRNSVSGGRFVDEVGFWNPQTKQKTVEVEKIKAWMAKGARPSNTIHNLLLKENVIKGKKVAVHNKPKKTAEVAKPAEEKKV